MAGGFNWEKTESQGDVSGMVITFNVDAGHSTILAPGDVVVIQAAANSDGKQQVDTGATSTANTGIVFGIEPIFAGEALNNTTLPASTAGRLRVNTDPHALYLVDSDSTLVAANVGQNIGIIAAAATATGGVVTSNMTLAQGTLGTAATLPFQVVELREDSTGTLGGAAVVRVNASTLSAGATGI